MRTAISLFFVAIGLLGFSLARYIFINDQSEETSIAYKGVTHNDSIKISKFLIEMADARLMDIEEGKVAKEQGTTKEIRDYGQLMVNGQPKLLAQLKKLAAHQGITLPSKISEEKAKGLADLKEKTGEDFDKKFVKMMKIDHRRDIRKMKKAQKYKNDKVKAFATEYLPTIEMHLEELKKID